MNSNDMVAPLIAKQLHDAYYGVNWTWSNVKEVLADVTWQEANKQVYGCNSIASLVYHFSYYIPQQLAVLNGGALEGNDKASFECPTIQSAQDWQDILNKIFAHVDEMVAKLQTLDDAVWANDFVDKKYGSYYRNISGMIEHVHYHLGQVVILKKVIRGQDQTPEQ